MEQLLLIHSKIQFDFIFITDISPTITLDVCLSPLPAPGWNVKEISNVVFAGEHAACARIGFETRGGGRPPNGRHKPKDHRPKDRSPQSILIVTTFCLTHANHWTALCRGMGVGRTGLPRGTPPGPTAPRTPRMSSGLWRPSPTSCPGAGLAIWLHRGFLVCYCIVYIPWHFIGLPPNPIRDTQQ